MVCNTGVKLVSPFSPLFSSRRFGNLTEKFRIKSDFLALKPLFVFFLQAFDKALIIHLAVFVDKLAVNLHTFRNLPGVCLVCRNPRLYLSGKVKGVFVFALAVHIRFGSNVFKHQSERVYFGSVFVVAKCHFIEVFNCAVKPFFTNGVLCVSEYLFVALFVINISRFAAFNLRRNGFHHSICAAP